MRLFYCPKHGRVEVPEDIAENVDAETEFLIRIDRCEHCTRWFYGMRRFKAKRPGES